MLRTRKTKVVSASPGGAGRGSGAITRKRVVLFAGPRCGARGRSSPWISAASSEASAAERRVALPSPPPRPSRRCRRRRPPRCRARAGSPGTGRGAAAGSSRRCTSSMRVPAPEEVGMHPDEMLADDVQPRVGQQVVDVGDPPVGRVLDRQHRPVRLARRAPRRWRPRRCGRTAARERETPRRKPGANRRRGRPGTRSCRSKHAWSLPVRSTAPTQRRGEGEAPLPREPPVGPAHPGLSYGLETWRAGASSANRRKEREKRARPARTLSRQRPRPEPSARAFASEPGVPPAERGLDAPRGRPRGRPRSEPPSQPRRNRLFGLRARPRSGRAGRTQEHRPDDGAG